MAVPQVSLLGPLLFILNVNDNARSSDLLFPILFTDDTSVFIEDTRMQKLFKLHLYQER